MYAMTLIQYEINENIKNNIYVIPFIYYSYAETHTLNSNIYTTQLISSLINCSDGAKNIFVFLWAPVDMLPC